MIPRFKLKTMQTHIDRALFCIVTGLSISAVAQAQEVAPSEPKVQKAEVQAFKAKRNLASNTSLSGEELKRMPGAGGDPMKAIQTLPGIVTGDDSSGEPAVRGARPNDNAYYIDFLPVGYLFHAGGLVSVLHPDLIRRFDIYTAAWSPEHGDVLGGVFDVSLRNPRTDKIGGRVNASFFSSSVLVEGPITENTSFFFAARRSWIDLLVKTGEDKKEGISYTIPSYNDVQARYLWTINDKNRLRFDLNTANDRIAFTLNKDSKVGQQDPVLLGSSASKQSFRNLATVLETDIGKTASNRFAIGQLVNQESLKIGSAGRLELKTTSTYVREQLETGIGKNHSLTTGFDLTSDLVDVDVDIKDPRCTEFDPNCDNTSAGSTTIRKAVRQNQASAYVSDRWNFAEDWTLTTGLRATRDGYLKRNSVDPRIGVEWAWSPQTVFSIGAGRHNQAPEKQESFVDVGNPRLMRLRSTQLALGVSQKLDGGWSWRAEVYGKRFDKFVVSDPFLNYKNGGSGSARGAELLVKKDASERLSGFFSLSLSKAKRRNDITGANFPFSFDQPVIANLVGMYKESERLQYSARWSYHTGSPDTPIIGTGTYPDGRVKPIYGEINSTRLPAYHRLDLRADYKYSARTTMYGELTNAYGRKNLAGYSYSADYKTREEIYQLPAFPSFGIEYKF
jgi:outer membrane receptor for ferrienterochelin and colicin